MKPGVNCGPASETMRRSQGLEKSVLDEVLRVSLISTQQKGRAEEPIPARLNEFLHGGGFAPLEPGDQFILIHYSLVSITQKGFNQPLFRRFVDCWIPNHLAI